MSPVPDTIVNPRTGQRMIFLQTAMGTGGTLLRIETVNPPGPPEPLHSHPRQVSSAEVLEGMLWFAVDGKERTIGPGERIEIPAGVVHCFRNDGPGDARAIQEFRPALRTEDFFRTWFALAADGKLESEKGMPSLLQLALLVSEFRDEMRPAAPPWPFLRAASALLAPVARLRGYRGTYGTTP